MRLDDEDRLTLSTLIARHDWIWILGNHDPEVPAEFAGRVCDETAIGPLVFRHAPLGLPVAGEVAGHLHPCAKIKLTGRRLRRRCFATDGSRLIMPAMGAYAGGLNVLDAAYKPHLAPQFVAWALGRDRVYPIRSDTLLPDT